MKTVKAYTLIMLQYTNHIFKDFEFISLVTGIDLVRGEHWGVTFFLPIVALNWRTRGGENLLSGRFWSACPGAVVVADPRIRPARVEICVLRTLENNYQF